jgi:ABC-type multidrug transport system fused ATPase/permease subunit
MPVRAAREPRPIAFAAAVPQSARRMDDRKEFPAHDRPDRSRSAAAGALLPRSLFRYVLDTSARHQLALLLLTIVVFLIEFVPLELQRRIVNDLVKNRAYRMVLVLCAAYAGVVLTHGATKLALNVYRGWVGERAVRDLRTRMRGLVGDLPAAEAAPEAQGVEVAVIVAEVEPVGGFVGGAVSEPLLQGGVLLTMLAYMIHIEPWMAATGVALFLPQLIFVPLMQGAINRRTGARVGLLRALSVSLIGPLSGDGTRDRADATRIHHIFELNMGVYRLKFGMNFLMNLCNHLQIVAALVLGGWFVLTDQLEIGGVVAFISAIGRLNDPWGDLVNYFRDVSVTRVKYGLVAGAANQLARGETPATRDC